MIAEESTSWTGVSRPVYSGGLGFGMKWMMGWMHDTLNYFGKDPIYRQYHQNDITFSIYYAFSENFMLPLSHDEVVHGKGSLIARMPGDQWQKFANLRALYTYMFTHPGTKLLFMGGEFGQYNEWDYHQSLDWHLLDHEPHRGLMQLVKDLNKLYGSEPALYEKAFEKGGFEWIDHNDNRNSVISYIRRGNQPDEWLVIICNFTPTPRDHYRLGVPEGGSYRVIFNSDAARYWGSNYGVGAPFGDAQGAAEERSAHGRRYSLELQLPPLGVIVLKKVN
jgi:1,4-alpha-glucan branching enzyme